MVGRFKWRITLSLANVVMAAVLFRLGLDEVKRNSDSHANPAPEYVPTAQRISYCMNLPPFVARNITVNYLLPKYRSRLRYHEGADYYILVFLFWWWMGAQIDRRGNPCVPAKPLNVIGCALGLIASLALLFLAGTRFAEGWSTLRLAAGFLMPTSAVIWGTGFLWFCGKRVVPVLKPKRGF